MRYENAGMSSEKAGENPAHRKSKISWVKFVFPGLVGRQIRLSLLRDA